MRVGDWVQVRSKEEILRTLDARGELDGMPFMPEMFSLCGKEFQVYKRAHKTCDTVFPTRGRRVSDAIHLETRCDGQAHGGCQAGCTIFWKEAWLKRIDVPGTVQISNAEKVKSACGGCSEATVWEQTQENVSDGNGPTYKCQATRLPYATSHLAWWDVRQYIEDYQSGNVDLSQIIKVAVYAAYYALSQAGLGLGPVMRWLYSKLYPLWGGPDFPRKSGSIPNGKPTPTGTLDLQPGELVQVKSHEDILRTLNLESKNRGMLWDAEMVPYCGNIYRVLKRVSKLINERTGKMQHMKNPCIILESVVCQAKYSGCRALCPRSLYPFWREIWLERVKPKLPTDANAEAFCSVTSESRGACETDLDGHRTGIPK
jgi:hypothetical protein